MEKNSENRLAVISLKEIFPRRKATGLDLWRNEAKNQY